MNRDNFLCRHLVGFLKKASKTQTDPEEVTVPLFVPVILVSYFNEVYFDMLACINISITYVSSRGGKKTSEN